MLLSPKSLAAKKKKDKTKEAGEFNPYKKLGDDVNL